MPNYDDSTRPPPPTQSQQLRAIQADPVDFVRDMSNRLFTISERVSVIARELKALTDEVAAIKRAQRNAERFER
jgi:hypothetical protein